MIEINLKELLKENLTIDLSYNWDYCGKELNVSVKYDGEEICSDSVVIIDRN